MAVSPTLSVPAFITSLEYKGVSLSLSMGQIKYSAPKNVLTPADAEYLRDQREDVTRYLLARTAVRARPNITPGKALLSPSIAQNLWWKLMGIGTQQESYYLSRDVLSFGNTTANRIDAALRAIIKKHLILRTSYSVEDGDLQVRESSSESLPIEFENISGSQGSLAGKAEDFFLRPLPADGDWLFRAKIFELPDHNYALALTINHIICDATSRMLLKNELERRIYGDTEGASDNADESIQFADYVAWEQDWLKSSGAPVIEYWRQSARNSPALVSPLDKRPLQWGAGWTQTYYFALPEHARKMVHSVARGLSTSPFLIYLTALATSVATWSGNRRFTIRSVRDERTVPALSKIIGLLVGADPILVNIPDQDDFAGNLLAIGREYYSSLQVRLPGITAFLPYVVSTNDPDIDITNNNVVVINFMASGSSTKRAQGAPSAAAENSLSEVWPPTVKKIGSRRWMRSSSFSLHIIDDGDACKMTLRLNGISLGAGEQKNFMDIFFAVFEKHILSFSP